MRRLAAVVDPALLKTDERCEAGEKRDMSDGVFEQRMRWEVIDLDDCPAIFVVCEHRDGGII